MKTKQIEQLLRAIETPKNDSPDRLTQILMVVLGGLFLAVVVDQWKSSVDAPTSLAVLSQQVEQLDGKVEKLNFALEEKTKDRIYRTEYDKDFNDLKIRFSAIEHEVVEERRELSLLYDRVDRNGRDIKELRTAQP